MKVLALAAGFGSMLVLCAAADAATSTRPAYGCYKVSSASAQIRDKASTGGSVIATASKGDVLIKNKRFCGFGGVFCAVTYNGASGYVEKSAVKAAPCPASTSKPKT